MKARLIFLILILPSVVWAESLKNDTHSIDDDVTVCITDDDWPPYVFSENNQSKKLRGASIDSIDFLFKKLNRNYVVKPMVWARLIHFTGKPFLSCDLIWGVNNSRVETYKLKASNPVYATKAMVFFDKKTLNKKQISQLSAEYLLSHKNNICGIRGYDYKAIDPLVNVRVTDNQQALNLLARSRCSLFFTAAEVGDYAIRSGMYALSNNVAYAPISGIETSYYAVTVKQDKRALKLLKDISEIIEQSVENGEWQKLYNKYGIRHGLDTPKQSKE